MSIVPADLFLSPTLTPEEASRYLATFGLADPQTADTRLQALAEDVPVREALARVADLLLDAVARAPDPDAALGAFVRHVEVRPATVTFLESLREDPRALGLLVETAGTSPFVADVLARSPELLHWLVREVDRPPPDEADLAREAGDLLAAYADGDARPAAITRLQRREMLRIASRDVLGRESLASASHRLSVLADLSIGGMLRIAAASVCEAIGASRLPGRVAAVALGRLGGREADYGREVELLYVYEPDDEGDVSAHEALRRVAETTSTLLAQAAEAGDLYRVELPLRAAALTGTEGRPSRGAASQHARCVRRARTCGRHRRGIEPARVGDLRTAAPRGAAPAARRLRGAADARRRWSPGPRGDTCLRLAGG